MNTDIKTSFITGFIAKSLKAIKFRRGYPFLSVVILLFEVGNPL